MTEVYAHLDVKGNIYVNQVYGLSVLEGVFVYVCMCTDSGKRAGWIIYEKLSLKPLDTVTKHYCHHRALARFNNMMSIC